MCKSKVGICMLATYWQNYSSRYIWDQAHGFQFMSVKLAHSPYTLTLFKKLFYGCNLQIFLISWSFSPWQAFPA